jgi:cathepsin C
MMKEILRNGAITGEIEFTQSMASYTSGIITASGLVELKKSLAQDINDKNFEDQGIDSVTISHSIVVLGWGIDKASNTKYWILRNSYGDDWGDKGDFKVKRGTNDFGIESLSSGYDVVLCSEANC